MTQHQGRLQNKVAVITGAATGIGRAIAVRYAMEGARVIVNDVNQTGTEATTSLIVEAGGTALACIADVSDGGQVDKLFDFTVENFGTVDVLVNNASLTNTERHFLEADEAWWDKIIAVNLKAAFLCSVRAARIMAPRRQGVIINLSSGGASRAHRGNAAYDAAKGGVEALTRAAALDLGPYGIRVNTIVPGSIDSKAMNQQLKQERGQVIPLGRVGEVEEIAGPAVFLASPDASYITGHIIYADGGLLVQQRPPREDIFPMSRFPKIEEL